VIASKVLVLGYVVVDSSRKVYPVSGHMELISTNDGGRVLAVIGGLEPGRKYRFSIAAITPAGRGPPAKTPWVTTR
jgi:hypothetical protein